MGFLLSTVKLGEPSLDHHTIPCTRRQNTDLRSEPPIFLCVFRVSAVPTLAASDGREITGVYSQGACGAKEHRISTELARWDDDCAL